MGVHEDGVDTVEVEPDGAAAFVALQAKVEVGEQGREGSAKLFSITEASIVLAFFRQKK